MESSRVRFGVNMRLLPVKVNYFCQFFVVASLFLYINPLLTSLGLTLWQVAVTALIANACSTISRTVFGSVTDMTNRLDLVSGGLSLTACISIGLFFVVPKRSEFLFEGRLDERGHFFNTALYSWDNVSNSSNPVTLCWPSKLEQCRTRLNESGTWLRLPKYTLLESRPFTSTAIYEPDEFDQNDGVVNHTLVICEEQIFNSGEKSTCVLIENQHTQQASTGVFILLMILRCLVAASQSPIMNLMDSATYAILGEEHSSQFGRSRMFGSLGYVTSALVTGLWIYRSGARNRGTNSARLQSHSERVGKADDYMPSLVLGIVFELFGTIAGFASHANVSSNRLQVRKAIKIALRSAEMIKCLINAMFVGLVISFIVEYNFLILLAEYQIPHYFLGIMIATQVMSEVPALLIAGRLLERFGVTTCLVFAFLTWALRLYIYASVPNYWLILCGEALFGLSFTLAYNTILDQSARASRSISADRTDCVLASMQAIATSILFGVSSCVGGFLWGLLLNVVKGRQVFNCVAAFCVAAAMLVPTIGLVIDQTRRRFVKVNSVFPLNNVPINRN